MPDSRSVEYSAAQYDAFLSYSSADRALVRRIQRFLESYRPPNRTSRLKVYLDETDMRGGSLPDNLSAALGTSRALVACWSDSAAGSPWVKAEIAEFRRLGRAARIAVAHVAGAGPTVKDAAFAGLEPLEHDLRNGWRAWLLTPKAKIELLRLIAFLTNVEMRQLRNWARRRMLRNALIGAFAALLPVAAVLSVPLAHWDEVPLSRHGQAISPIACEVVNGKLWAAAWSEAAGEVSGARAYFVTYPDVLARPEEEIARPRFFILPKRALPKPLVSPDIARGVEEVLDANGVTGRLKQYSLRDTPRIAQPRPDRFVFIQPILLSESDRQVAEMVAARDRSPVPETAGSVVVVHKDGSPPRLKEVKDLSPPQWKDWSTRNRRTSPARAMSVVWQSNDEIWIGVAGERELTGGLWHSPDAGENWEKIDGFFSVTSLDLVATPNTGKEILMVGEQGFKHLSDDRLVPGNTKIVERASGNGWIESRGPPHGSDSEIEICGTLDGTLNVRVDGKIHQRRSRPLYRSVADTFGTSSR